VPPKLASQKKSVRRNRLKRRGLLHASRLLVQLGPGLAAAPASAAVDRRKRDSRSAYPALRIAQNDNISMGNLIRGRI
jgi:hypothetical protein